MSMLTNLADRLREMAESTDWEMPEAAMLMREAADTIISLRDRLQAAELGSGTCEVECFDNGTDEGMDGEWFSYAPPTWYLSCGHTAQGAEKPNFCHVCGKAVE